MQNYYIFHSLWSRSQKTFNKYFVNTRWPIWLDVCLKRYIHWNPLFFVRLIDFSIIINCFLNCHEIIKIHFQKYQICEVSRISNMWSFTCSQTFILIILLVQFKTSLWCLKKSINLTKKWIFNIFAFLDPL